MKEFLDPGGAKKQILGGAQLSLVKNGQLDAASADIHHKGTLFDIGLKPVFFQGQCLVVQKTGFAVALDFYVKSGLDLDLIHYDQTVFCLTQSAGSVYLPVFRVEIRHDTLEIIQYGTDLTDCLIGDKSPAVGLSSEKELMSHMREFLYAMLPGNFIDFHGQLACANVDGGKRG